MTAAWCLVAIDDGTGADAHAVRAHVRARCARIRSASNLSATPPRRCASGPSVSSTSPGSRAALSAINFEIMNLAAARRPAIRPRAADDLCRRRRPFLRTVLGAADSSPVPADFGCRISPSAGSLFRVLFISVVMWRPAVSAGWLAMHRRACAARRTCPPRAAYARRAAFRRRVPRRRGDDRACASRSSRAPESLGSADRRLASEDGATSGPWLCARGARILGGASRRAALAHGRRLGRLDWRPARRRRQGFAMTRPRIHRCRRAQELRAHRDHPRRLLSTSSRASGMPSSDPTAPASRPCFI